jgi:hypothetical protein
MGFLQLAHDVAWQQSDWPGFCRDPLRVAKAEEHFLREATHP